MERENPSLGISSRSKLAANLFDSIPNPWPIRIPELFSSGHIPVIESRTRAYFASLKLSTPYSGTSTVPGLITIFHGLFSPAVRLASIASWPRRVEHFLSPTFRRCISAKRFTHSRLRSSAPSRRGAETRSKRSG